MDVVKAKVNVRHCCGHGQQHPPRETLSNCPFLPAPVDLVSVVVVACLDSSQIEGWDWDWDWESEDPVVVREEASSRLDDRNGGHYENMA